MKSKKLTKIIAVFTVAVMLLSLAAGCSKPSAETDTPSPSGDSTAAGASGADAGEGVTDILIGTSGSPAPYNWVEANGSIGGYEPAVLAELAELLPQYNFAHEKTEFPAIFTGIDTGRYQIGSNNLSKTPEREERYYFTNENHIFNTLVIAFKKGRTDIQSVNDLSGKKVTTQADGVAFQLFLENFNTNHPDAPIDIKYSEQDWLTTFQSIDNGTDDFAVFERAILNNYEEEFGIELDFITLDSSETYGLLNLESYFVFPKTEAGGKLRDDIDGALKTLKENGKLVELSNEFFGFNMFE